MARNTLLDHWAALYTNQTPAEKAMEPVIAALGVRYRTQHVFWGLHVIPDFVLLDHKLVMEVDDKSHSTKAKQAKDAERTAKLNRAGWQVVRTTNAAALDNPGAALKQMLCDAKLTHLLKGS